MNMWTQQEVERLCELWPTPMTIRDMERELQRPKSTISEKAKRLGLTPRRAKGVQSTPEINIEIVTKVVEVRAATTSAATPIVDMVSLPRIRSLETPLEPCTSLFGLPYVTERPDAGPLPLIDTKHDRCKWPTWGDERATYPDALCCGDPTDGTSIYCAAHRARAYSGIPPEITETSREKFTLFPRRAA